MIEVLGLDVTIARFLALEGAVAKAADAGAEHGGEAVLEAATATVPVDTGNLRDSLQTTKDTDGGTLVGTEVAYAVFVEYGTSVMAAQPFLRPALDTATDEVTNDVNEALQIAIRSVAGI